MSRRWPLVLLVLLVSLLTACGGGEPVPSTRDNASDPEGSVGEEPMELTEEERAELAEAGNHPDGLLQGVPTSCRLAGEDADQGAAARIIAEIGDEVSRGPLIAVEAGDGTVVLATTLVSADGAMTETAAWVGEATSTTVTAANDPAAELTPFELDPVDTAAEAPAASALAEASDCSWIVADRTHEDPPEPEPEMRSDLLVLDPSRAEPGELIAMRFPEETGRGVAFQLDRRADEGWEPVAWMTSDGNGGEPTTVPAFTEGHGWPDVGVLGPGPDHVRLPDDAPAGEYRICTRNAGDEFCAPLEIR